MNAIEQYVGELDGARERRGEVSTKDWVSLGRLLVSEYERLDRSLINYGFVFSEDHSLFKRYAMLDLQVEKLRGCIDVLDERRAHAPALVKMLQERLPSDAIDCVVSAIFMYAETQKSEGGDPDAFAIRSMSAYSRYMEPRYRAYQAKLRRRRDSGSGQRKLGSP